MDYWSCSRFASYIWRKVGHPKPKCATWEEWDEWNKIAEEKHPFANFFCEGVLDRVQKVIRFPSDTVYSLLYGLKNFTQRRSYIETPHSSLFSYSDFTYKIEAGLFYELEKFVDVECAWMNHMNRSDFFVWVKGAFVRKKIDRRALSKDGLEFLEFQRDMAERVILESAERQIEPHPAMNERSEQYQALIDVYKWVKEVYNDPDRDEEATEPEVEAALVTLVRLRGLLWT